MTNPRRTIDAILREFHVTSFKITRAGRLAIRKGGQWQYFKWNVKTGMYDATGSTLKLQHT